MTLESCRLGLYRLRITRAQQDVHHICEGQTLGIGSIFNYKYVSGLANYALGKEETCCQLVVMSGRSHNHRQAPAVDTHFKRFFNSQLVFILLLLIFLPVGYTDVHHAFGIKRRTPEAWYRHLSFTSSLVVWYRPNRRLWALAFEVVLTGARTDGVGGFNSNQAPPLLLQPAPGLVLFVKVAHDVPCYREYHCT